MKIRTICVFVFPKMLFVSIQSIGNSQKLGRNSKIEFRAFVENRKKGIIYTKRYSNFAWIFKSEFRVSSPEYRPDLREIRIDLPGLDYPVKNLTYLVYGLIKIRYEVLFFHESFRKFQKWFLRSLAVLNK